MNIFLINPAIIYSVVWLLALSLYQLHFSNILTPLNSKTVVYILLSVVMVCLAWITAKLILYKVRFPKYHVYDSCISNDTFFKIRCLFATWVIGTCITLIYLHDLPILTIFGWSHMTYADYGITSLQGFLNAILQSISIYMLYLYLTIKNRRYLYFFILTLLFPLFTLNRGMLTSMVLEALFTFLVFSSLRTISLVKLFLFAMFFIVFFGLMGEFRYIGVIDDSDLIYKAFNISEDYPIWLPKSFIWFYLYVTTPLMNISNIIYQFPDFSFQPYVMIFSTFPTLLRSILEAPVTINLANPAFNVASFMPHFLTAYGYVGSLIFYYFASFISFYYYYKFLLKGRLTDGFILIILLHSIVLSIFSDFFFIATYIFQIILQYYVFGLISYNNFLKKIITSQKKFENLDSIKN